MIRRWCMKAVLACIVSVGGTRAWADDGGTSAATFLDTDVSSMHWSVIHDRTVTLRWAYPSGAESVKLTIVNALGRQVLAQELAAPDETYEWTVVAGDSVAEDDCFTLTLDFSNGDRESTRLALLRGSFGATKVRVPSSDDWGRVNGRHAVVPYGTQFLDGVASPATLAVQSRAAGGLDAELSGAAGWYGWRGKNAETFDLTLSAAGAETLSSALTFFGPGMCLIFR